MRDETSAYMCMFMLGASNVLPWLSFITAVDYFLRLYPFNIEYYFSVVICL